MKNSITVIALLLVLLFTIVKADVVPFSSSPYSTFKVGTHSWIVSNTATQWNSSGYVYFMQNYGGVSTITMQEGDNTFELNSIDLYGPSWSYIVTVKGFLDDSEEYTQDFTVNTTSFQTFSVSGWTGINKVQVINPGNSISVGYDNLNYTPENAAPTGIVLPYLSSFVMDGSPSGTILGAFSTVDEFVGGSHTYTFADGGTDNTSFSISGSNLITAFVADYDTKSSYSIRIRSTDSEGLWYEKDFSITVQPIAPDAYEVSGAEDSNYNGIYSRDGSYYDFPQYSKDGTYYLFNYDCTNHWSLDTDPEWSGCPLVYCSSEDTPLPPSSGYMQGCVGDNNSSGLTITATTLDIELISFYSTCDDGEVELVWKTEFESNVAGFYIERSIDKENWIEIASCQTHVSLVARGMFTPQCTYSFIDASALPNQLYYYRLGEITTTGHRKLYSELSTRTPALPTTTELNAVYPNPFNPEVNVEYTVADAADVRIDVFDLLGRQIANLVYENQTPGEYIVTWDATSNGMQVSSGSYFIRMKTKDKVAYRKVLYVK